MKGFPQQMHPRISLFYQEAKNLSGTLPSRLPFASHWPELSHGLSPNCSGGWELKCLKRGLGQL